MAKSPYTPSLSGRLYSAMNCAYLSLSLVASVFSSERIFLTLAVLMLVSTLFCCRISRETLRGRSSESMMPRTKRRYCGSRSLESSMMKTRRT